ncbi:PD40 domain-containing protein [bacterium]|nr:PD40 domain-containing protein [bacterium]
MVKSIRFAGVLLILITLSISCTKESQLDTQIQKEPKFSQLTGPYLGQKPPGDVPELFAPGIIADIYREHSATKFTPDGKEAFWTRVINQGIPSRIDVILHMKLENGTWTKPERAPFCIGPFSHISSISPDGNRIYFISQRPIVKGGEPKYGSWIVEKTEDGWGEPRLYTLIPNWESLYMACQETRSGDLYLQENNLPNMDRGIGFSRSKIMDGKYQQPTPIGETINSEYLDFAFYIDPDEEFVIFASDRPGGLVDGVELYISYHQADDSWGEAINLGEKINTFGVEGAAWPYISPDGKYFFFISEMQPFNDMYEKNYSYAELKEISLSYTNGYAKIYWVSASFIDELKPGHLK